jgi:hypothetical protein
MKLRYPAWDARIDPLIGDVKRVEWSYTPAKSMFSPISSQFGPIQNLSSPALACKAKSLIEIQIARLLTI